MIRSFWNIYQQCYGGIEDVQKRGKSEAGQKTMLDTLIPAAKQLENEIEQGSCNKDIIENVIKAAEVGCESTKTMKALKEELRILVNAVLDILIQVPCQVFC